MKKRTLLFTCGLSLMLSFGVFHLSFADGEPGDPDGTYTSSACTYTDSQGKSYVGSQCSTPAYQGPCSFETTCH